MADEIKLRGIKRPPNIVTETCVRCRRPDWTHRVPFAFWTEVEWGKPIEVEGMPSGLEPLLVGAGASIYDAIEEAINYCREYNVPGVGFIANGQLVVLNGESEKFAVAHKWFIECYGRDPEESPFQQALHMSDIKDQL